MGKKFHINILLEPSLLYFTNPIILFLRIPVRRGATMSLSRISNVT